MMPTKLLTNPVPRLQLAPMRTEPAVRSEVSARAQEGGFDDQVFDPVGMMYQGLLVGNLDFGVIDLGKNHPIGERRASRQ